MDEFKDTKEDSSIDVMKGLYAVASDSLLVFLSIRKAD